jgi:L-amino acid N-acyltransferase YncA
MIIRPVTLRDTRAVIDVLNPIIEEGKYTILDKPYTLEEEIQFIKTFPETGIFNVADEEGVIQGFHVIERIYAPYTHAFNHVGQVGTFIGKEHQRRGVGRRLILESEKFAIEKGYRKLFAFIRADNLRSLEFHEALGFEEIGRAKEHVQIRGEYIDEIFMEKLLKH